MIITHTLIVTKNESQCIIEAAEYYEINQIKVLDI